MLKRRDVTAKLNDMRGESRIISGLGSSTYDLHSTGDTDHNFYLWGAMGGAAMVGLGVAMAQPDSNVIVLTGDGEMLMGIGSLATIGVQKPANLSVIVLDNGHFGETGMQASHTNSCVDLAKIAAASGFKRAETIETEQELERFLQLFQDASGPSFAAIKVEQEAPPRSLPILDGVELKNRFRRTFNLFPK